MPERLSEDALTTALQGSQWTRDGDAIVRDHRFADFAAAMAFVNRVAEVAGEADHRPDILVDGSNTVRLTLSTHSAGGLTRADLELAERLEQVPTG
jgi:4a-hydroxytetrahydrobiopterin dehydratase